MIPAPQDEEITRKILEALKTCYDPEIPFNIVDLGLIYGLDVDKYGNVRITMTVTSPGCPVGPWLIDEVKNACSSVPGVKRVDVDLVFEPLWTPRRMSEEAHRILGF